MAGWFAPNTGFVITKTHQKYTEIRLADQRSATHVSAHINGLMGDMNWIELPAETSKEIYRTWLPRSNILSMRMQIQKWRSKYFRPGKSKNPESYPGTPQESKLETEPLATRSHIPPTCEMTSRHLPLPFRSNSQVHQSQGQPNTQSSSHTTAQNMHIHTSLVRRRDAHYIQQYMSFHT